MEIKKKDLKAFHFFSKFNWRFILIHLAASLLIIVGIKNLALLTDIDLLEAVQKYPALEAWNHLSKTNTLSLGDFFLYQALSSLFGLMAAFVISLVISKRKKIFRFNTLIVFLLTIFIQSPMCGILNMGMIKNTLNTIGDMFIYFGIQYALIINGTLLVFIGLFLFFSKRTTKFILKQYNEEPEKIINDPIQ